MALFQSFALAATIPLSPGADKVDVTLHAEIMEDTSGRITLAQAASPRLGKLYHPIGAEALGLGFSESVYWLRFRLGPGQPGDWVFVPAWIPVDGTAMYMVRHSGGAVAYTELERLDPGAFKLPGNASDAWFYLKIWDPLGVYLTLDLMRDMPFHSWSTNRSMLLGIFFGVLIGLMAYSLSMYGALRDPGHGWFVAYMACMTAYFALFTGVLPAKAAWRNSGVLVLAGVGIIAIGQFSRFFLMTRTRSRFFDRLIILYMLGTAGCCLAIPFTTRSIISDCLSVAGLASQCVNLLAGVAIWARGFRPARYYVLAEAQSSLAVGWYISTLRGLIPPTPYGFVAILASTAVETVLLALALAERITTLKREKDSLAAASKAKNEFLASISHELRTPMSLIMGMAEMLERTELDTRQRKLLNNLTAAGKSLVALISNLLDIAKIESGRMDLDLAPFDLSALAVRMRDIFEPGARDKGVELKLSLDSQAAGVRMGDGFKLEQVLINLLGNAVKFTDQGSVELRVEAQNQDRVRFTVRDTGMGIPKNRQQAVFKHFTQGGLKVRERFGGSGLGLAISKRLVMMMGGGIQLASRPGKGSEFSFVLDLPPATACPVPMSEAADAGAVLKSMGRARVLVVDDVAANLELIKLYLEGLPLDIDECRNGTRAVEMFKANDYQAVIMDIMMDMVDGREAAKAMRRLEASRPGKRTPLIAVSAAAFDTDVQKSLDTGFDLHLAKPLARSVLLTAMAELMCPDHAPGEDQARVNRKLEASPEEITKETPTALVESHFAPLIPKIRASFEKMARDALDKARSGDCGGLARTGHAIKGAGLNFGLDRAAEIGQALQELGEAGDTAEACAIALALLDWAENVALDVKGGSVE